MSNDVLALFPELVAQSSSHNTTGLLPSQKLEELIFSGYVTSAVPITNDQIQPSSIDLRLGPKAYRVPASFLPGKLSTVTNKLHDLTIEELDISTPTVLEKTFVYIVPLHESLMLPKSISGLANPKSSTGRLDVFVRLITDYGTAFEEVPAGYKGRLYAEIVPLTFRIVVREGTRLNQLRLRLGDPPPSDAMLHRMHAREPLVYSADESPAQPMVSEGLRLSVDLTGPEDSDVVGYKARENTDPIDLSRVAYYEPLKYWAPVRRNPTRTLVLDPAQFYILVSKQKVSIPFDVAAEMIPYDPSVGEFRIHYAGFFDPGFGSGSAEQKGAHAVLEVRSHDVPSLLEDGQIVCRLIYEQMLEPPRKLYGKDIGSSYQSQRLALSKHFMRI